MYMQNIKITLCNQYEKLFWAELNLKIIPIDNGVHQIVLKKVEL